eukprot:TRINITY_DN107191_c0_g1_i1.p1 TRINITY_DN107191_c0_g1~~TRINITY_DN107191_c0_g1_i1.p1  ORF type:complete len:256 (-),score=29.33 TRINITY_DN107191_c0_g1_i1:19-750(-)
MSAAELKAGVNCTGMAELTDNHGSIALFHSPFEEALTQHLDSHLGQLEHVMSSLSLGCHLYLFRPQESTPWWTVMTMGLSGFTMPAADCDQQHCELVISLPQEVGCPRRATETEELCAQSYAAELLLWLARYIVESNVLFRPGDGIAGNPFSGMEPPYEGMQLSCAMLQQASHLGETFPTWRGINPYTQCQCTVNFYAVIPLTPDEYEFRRHHGTAALCERMEQQLGHNFRVFVDDREQVSLD